MPEAAHGHSGGKDAAGHANGLGEGSPDADDLLAGSESFGAEAGMPLPGFECTQKAGAFNGVAGGGEPVGGEAGGQGGRTGVEVGLPVFRQVGVDRFQDVRGQALDVGQGHQRGAAGMDHQLRVRGEQRGELACGEVGPAGSCGDQGGEGGAGPYGCLRRCTGAGR
ncbi:hypothetical protein [Streptomyces sp. NPDC001978]|uniref:hypothetical protein n=1 Tax=Streptomyces sp. NPDC001978 TaxID=3364627 RepID=UPI0036746D78